VYNWASLSVRFGTYVFNSAKKYLGKQNIFTEHGQTSFYKHYINVITIYIALALYYVLCNLEYLKYIKGLHRLCTKELVHAQILVWGPGTIPWRTTNF
jgi:hypothetical protein